MTTSVQLDRRPCRCGHPAFAHEKADLEPCLNPVCTCRMFVGPPASSDPVRRGP